MSARSSCFEASVCSFLHSRKARITFGSSVREKGSNKMRTASCEHAFSCPQKTAMTQRPSTLSP